MNWIEVGTIITIISGLSGFIVKKLFKDVRNAHLFIKNLQSENKKHQRNIEFLHNKILTFKLLEENQGSKFEDIDWDLE